MKFYFIILSLLPTLKISCGQKNPIFKIETIEVKNQADRKSPADFEKSDAPFYEDDSFIVTKTCNGEWGGSVWFKDKNTGIEYGCESTCAVSINKLNGVYFITNTLAHIMGYSEVLEVDNPRDLEKVVNTGEKKRGTFTMGTNESKSRKGTKIIIDTTRILTLAAFVYQNKLYQVITDRSKTYVAEIVNGKFKNVQLLANLDLHTADPEVIQVTDNHSVVFLYEYDKVSGYLDMAGNELKLYLYK